MYRRMRDSGVLCIALTLSACGATKRNTGATGDESGATWGASSVSGGVSSVDGGASSVSGTDTSGVSDASGGAPGTSGGTGSGGAGGAAGSRGTISDRVRYTACDWADTQSDVKRVKVARWDDEICACTVAVFERVDACPTEVTAQGWCLTGALQTEDPTDCEDSYMRGDVPLAAAGFVEGLGTGTVFIELELDFESNVPQSNVRLDSERCHADCSLDCEAPSGTYPGTSPPEARAVFVTHACDHYDVWVYGPDGFYIGALDWTLAIGDVGFGAYRCVGNYAIVFAIPDDEFEALDDGAPIMSGYGTPDGIYGYLDKSSVL